VVSPSLPEVKPEAACSSLAAEAERERRLKMAYGGTLLSAVLIFASFHPLDLGLLAWVAFVPWLYVAATEGRRIAIAVSYSTTVLYHLVGLAWIGMVSPEGWLVTTFLEGFYGIALALLPLWIRARTGTPLLFSLPALGAALEWLRGNTPVIRFPWLLLGSSQHANETLIQVADLTSVYGLTFLVLMVNGALVDAALLVRARWQAERDLDARDRRRLMLYAAVPLALLSATWIYGAARRAQVRDALRPGPRVLVVQPDFPQNLKDAAATEFDLVRTHFAWTDRSLGLGRTDQRPERVDAIVWSETMWPWPLPDVRTQAGRDGWKAWLQRLRPSYAEAVASSTRQLLALADETGATVLVGAVDRGLDGGPEHNSVYAVAPQQGVIARYDKVNPVPASEYIPGKGSALFGWFHALIKSFIPAEFNFTEFTPGAGPVLMPAGAHQLSPNICFEISFPELLRRGTAAGATALVCPANDGWFVRGGRGEDNEAYISTAEIALARDHAVLRAIESRRPVVRCVNRGHSLVVDPTGAITDEVVQKVMGKDRRIGVEGAFIADLQTTDLRTFYVRAGDAFALACGAVAAGLLGCAAGRKRLVPEPDGPATSVVGSTASQA
jgi:apolipoprotein N-acyltransferase